MSRVQAASSGPAPTPSSASQSEQDDLDFLDSVLEDIRDDQVSSLMNVYRYDGFDARRFKILLAGKINAASLGNKLKAREMITNLLAIIIERGSKVKKRNGGGDFKMTTAATQSFLNLVRTLGITAFEQGVTSAGTQPANAVTLARIATVLVAEIGAVLAKHPDKVKAPSKILPACFCTPGSTALIPGSVAGNAPIYDAIKEWNLGFAQLTNQDMNLAAVNVVKFMNIAQNGNLYSEEERKVALRKLKALSTDVPEAAWVALFGEAAYNMIFTA